MIKGSHCASLGTLPFKASTDLPDFKDPVIADRPKDALVRSTIDLELILSLLLTLGCPRCQIIVNCGLGGQAMLGAKLLLDYGFSNVKTIEGGCVAYNKAFPPACCVPKRG